MDRLVLQFGEHEAERARTFGFTNRRRRKTYCVFAQGLSKIPHGG